MSSLPERILSIEERTGLLLAVEPADAQQCVARFSADWAYGKEAELAYRYRPAPHISGLRNELEQIYLSVERGEAKALSSFGETERHLLLDRILELDLECQLVAYRGRAEFRRLALERYHYTSTELSQAETMAKAWLKLRYQRSSEPLVDLYSFAREHELCQSHGIEVASRRMLATAGIARDTLFVQSGLRVPRLSAERILVHEVLGHLLPRQAARTQSIIFRTGVRGALDDEEGRAVLLEEQHRLLTDARKRELAVRFIAAQCCRAGQDAVDVANTLVALGVEREELVPVIGRVFRGGGLGRELVYLASFGRVQSALAGNPALKDWLSAGRLSVAAAQRLSKLRKSPPR